MKVSGMTKQELIELIDTPLTRARIARDNGNEKAHDAVMKLTAIKMKARSIKTKAELTLYLISEKFLIPA